MSTRLCPVPGCGARVTRSGYLMCNECWHRVPKHQQRAVNRTWRNLSRARTDYPVARSMLATLYRDARDAAIKAAEAAR